MPSFMTDLQRKLHAMGRHGPVSFALAGIDIALWDLVGKAQEVPLHRLLGRASRDRIPTYASLLRYDNPDLVARFTQEAIGQGYTAVKLHEHRVPWPDDLQKWDTLSADEKRLFARQAEVFAAYAAYTDHEIDRVIQAVEDMGKFDNTLIIYISGDNGTSAEGTLRGTFNQMTAYNAILDLPIAEQMKHYDAWGSETTYPHMSVAWSWAFDTPFKWTKQVASHFGGTRQGMCIAWPKRIKDAGGIRHQFHHMIDIVPTILEVTGIQAPDAVNGIKQKPIEGISMAYTFDAANAKAPSKRDTQYFEMFGNRGIYHDGWYACTTPPEAVWLLGAKPLPPMNDYKWELYNIAEDYSQYNDLSAKNPDKLKELEAVFMTEAGKYQVFPLDNSVLPRIVTPRPSAVAGRTEFTYSGPNANIPVGNAPSILDKDYTITAEITVQIGRAHV